MSSIGKVICFDCREGPETCDCNQPVILCDYCYAETKHLRGALYCRHGCGLLKVPRDTFETTRRELKRLSMGLDDDFGDYPPDNAGFMMVSASMATLIFSILILVFVTLISWAAKAQVRLTNTINNMDTLQITRVCPSGKPCGKPVLCIKTENNKKDITYCDGKCIWMTDHYEYESNLCLEVLSK